jgi:hypothetical protein
VVAPRRGIILVDAIVGSILLGVALSVVIGLAGRALAAQTRGEELQTAAMMLDEQLALVLARGPDGYSSRFETEGECDPPFQRFRFQLEFAGGTGGAPYHVTATVSWSSGGRTQSESVETCIAPRLGDEPDPDRRPDQNVDRMQ